jgi:plasmid stabilization system protein ParE
MMRIRFAEAANNELNDACDWFEQQQAGLGARFRDEVREATLRIARFPYTLRYVLRGDEVWFMAVSHQHRRPDYWVERIQNQ